MCSSTKWRLPVTERWKPCTPASVCYYSGQAPFDYIELPCPAGCSGRTTITTPSVPASVFAGAALCLVAASTELVSCCSDNHRTRYSLSHRHRRHACCTAAAAPASATRRLRRRPRPARRICGSRGAVVVHDADALHPCRGAEDFDKKASELASCTCSCNSVSFL